MCILCPDSLLQGSGAGSPTAGSRGSSGLGLARGVLTAAARSGWNNIVGAGGGQQATGSTSSGAGRGRGTGAGGRGQGGGDWSGAAGGAGGVQEAQQVQAMEQENRALLVGAESVRETRCPDRVYPGSHDLSECISGAPTLCLCAHVHWDYASSRAAPQNWRAK